MTEDEMFEHVAIINNDRVDEEYIGDGVYASFDGYQIWLKVNDRYSAEIAIEPKVYKSLTEYIHKIETKYNFRYISE